MRGLKLRTDFREGTREPHHRVSYGWTSKVKEVTGEMLK